MSLLAHDKQEKKWLGHEWTTDAMLGAMEAGDSDATPNETIQLVAIGKEHTATVSKNLLCLFSRYYAAALNGNFSEAKQTTFSVSLTSRQLMLFVGWLYSGTTHAWTSSSFNAIWERAALQSYRNIYRAFSSLPDNSPLCRWMIDEYVHHWDQNKDMNNFPAHWDKLPANDKIYDVGSKELRNVLDNFFDEVMHGCELNAGHEFEECACCNSVCNYHEHESMEEWQATCGKSVRQYKPFKRYLGKTLHRLSDTLSSTFWAE